MFSLLALTLAVSASAAAAQAVDLQAPLVTPPAFVLQQPNGSMTIAEQPPRPADDMEIHPDADVCYKIRAYIFSGGRNPRLLRETTCGPQASRMEKVDGTTTPEFLPLDMKATPDGEPQQ